MIERWQIYAVAAAVFAGITAVIAKMGLQKVGADAGLLVRTGFVMIFVILNTLLWNGASKVIAEIEAGGWKPIAWLALSALTTTLSWVCYYRAMHEGTVAHVSLIDKGSVIVTVLLSVLLLGETMTWRLGLGTSLVAAGLMVMAWGK